jgi:hypothetical protein
MAKELVCPEHGPYDASYGRCPYCYPESGNRPVAPTPLDEDDLATDLGGSPARYDAYEDEAETDLGDSRRSRRFLDEDEEPTDFYDVADETELFEEETGTIAILWVKDGHRRGHIYKVKDGTVVARSEGDIRLEDSKVSNPHARFRLEDDKFTLWDFGSKNGTTVNGERIRAATELKENDEIQIGESTFVIKILE